MTGSVVRDLYIASRKLCFGRFWVIFGCSPWARYCADPNKMCDLGVKIIILAKGRTTMCRNPWVNISVVDLVQPKAQYVVGDGCGDGAFPWVFPWFQRFSHGFGRPMAVIMGYGKTTAADHGVGYGSAIAENGRSVGGLSRNRVLSPPENHGELGSSC